MAQDVRTILRANGRFYQVIDLKGLDPRTNRSSLLVEAGSRIGLAYARWCSEPSGLLGRTARWLASVAVTPSASVIQHDGRGTEIDAVRLRGTELGALGGRIKEAAVDTVFLAAKAVWLTAAFGGALALATTGAGALAAMGATTLPAFGIAGVFAVGAVIGKSVMTSWQDSIIGRRRLAAGTPFADRPAAEGTRSPEAAGPGQAKPSEATGVERTQQPSNRSRMNRKPEAPAILARSEAARGNAVDHDLDTEEAAPVARRP